MMVRSIIIIAKQGFDKFQLSVKKTDIKGEWTTGYGGDTLVPEVGGDDAAAYFQGFIDVGSMAQCLG